MHAREVHQGAQANTLDIEQESSRKEGATVIATMTKTKTASVLRTAILLVVEVEVEGGGYMMDQEDSHTGLRAAALPCMRSGRVSEDRNRH